MLTYAGGDVFEAEYVAGVKEGKYWYRCADQKEQHGDAVDQVRLEVAA